MHLIRWLPLLWREVGDKIMPRTSPWTDDLSQRLAVLWAERATSTAAIAKVFQSEGYTFTKNSIIGRARRMGLPPKEKWLPKAVFVVVKHSKYSPEPERPAVGRSKVEVGEIGAAVQAINRAKRKKATNMIVIQNFSPRVADIASFKKPLLDLRAMECHWPDDERNADGLHTFCGHPTDNHSYCKAHREINRGHGTPSERAAIRVREAA